MCLSVGQEIVFTETYNESPNDLLILAFIDGEYSGICCSCKANLSSRRFRYRAGIEIFLFIKYMGIGSWHILIERWIKYAQESGFEQIELISASIN